MKFGRVKRQHGRVGGLDAILDRIVKQCPHVTRIVPGRIKVRRGKTPPSFRIQYPTDAGLKCLYNGTGTVQEVFLICTDPDEARAWLTRTGIAQGGGE
jgi:hypothetical protein